MKALITILQKLKIWLGYAPPHEHVYTIERWMIGGIKFYQCNCPGCMMHVPYPEHEKFCQENSNKFSSTLVEKNNKFKEFEMVNFKEKELWLLYNLENNPDEKVRIFEEYRQCGIQSLKLLQDYKRLNDLSLLYLKHSV